MYDIKTKLPEIGKKVLCWFEERGELVIDEAKQLSPSDGGRVCFVHNYIHNYTHWTELPNLADTTVSYKEALETIAEMKIPYCDAYDVANSMREIAQDAITPST